MLSIRATEYFKPITLAPDNEVPAKNKLSWDNYLTNIPSAYNSREFNFEFSQGTKSNLKSKESLSNALI
jgi:hypothetical protein